MEIISYLWLPIFVSKLLSLPTLQPDAVNAVCLGGGGGGGGRCTFVSRRLLHKGTGYNYVSGSLWTRTACSWNVVNNHWVKEVMEPPSTSLPLLESQATN